MLNITKILLKRIRAFTISLLILAGAFQGKASAQLNVGVEVNPDPAMPESILYVRITVSNTATSASGSVRLEVEYPEGLEGLGDVLLSDGGDCTTLVRAGQCDAGEVVFWNLGIIGPGGGRTLTFPPVVAAATDAGTMIPFAARVLEDDVELDSTAQNVEIVDQTATCLSVDAAQEPVPAGALLKYALTVGNRGASSVRKTELEFPLPAGTGFVSASSGATINGGFVRWNLGTFFRARAAASK